MAGALAVVLAVSATRYGYHRDELYFLVLGAHPAAGYVDQPPLVPLLAHLTDVLSHGSLFWLRVPPALASAAAVVVTAAIARELGARTSGQVLAAVSWAISAVVLASGHLAGTTAFDLLVWTLVGWTVVRALRDGGTSWLWVGLAAGVGLEVKSLVAFLLVALLVGLLVLGPRAALRSPWPWLAALLAVLLWLPNLWWQAAHGWPQLDLAGQIASGSSGTSEPRGLFIPFQFVLLSPVLIPLWGLGLWRLWRDPALRTWRCFAAAYVVLVVLFLVTGGKPYYLCGIYPVLLAAGAQPVVDRSRPAAMVPALAVGLAINAVLFLPVLPVGRLAGTPVPTINYDAGETVGWHGFVDTVRTAWADVPNPGRAAIVTANYGEAGAIARFAPELPVYSGHNSLRDLGGPPGDTSRVLAIGYRRSDLTPYFEDVRRVATTPTPSGLDNDEAGGPVYLATEPTTNWPVIWDRLARTG